jgi:hypothetical protein
MRDSPVKKERELAHESQLFNLDNEGTSHFTYPAEPNSPVKSYNPKNYMPPTVKSPYSQYSQNPKLN